MCRDESRMRSVPEAIRMHTSSHPNTLHLTEDIFTVALQKYITGCHVALMSITGRTRRKSRWHEPETVWCCVNEEMKMAVLNYTTAVDSFKTVSEIEYILMKHKAKSIRKNYDGKSVTGLSFLIDTGFRQIPVRLPVKVDECLKVLKKEKNENLRKQIKDTRDQAERVAWRMMKDWVEAQMALLDIEMVRFEEIFLPYIETENGRTVYERLEEKQFLLEE